ncbi:hypothetical protein [Actinoplanes sp. NPDC049118]|uniref:cell division protein ZapB n=1 Tax=Actinoplanes sp. NPDC049118 TaxID=3155769 RepID=UPI0033D0DC98
MGGNADSDVVELAARVLALVRRRFEARPWAQLVAQLSPQERDALGGGEPRQLSSRLSAQFGAKARRGPNGVTIQVVLRHCLHSLDEDQRAQSRAEILELFRRVRGPDAALSAPPAPAPPRPRAGGLGVQVQQLRGENETLVAENRQLRQANVELLAELGAAQARIEALEMRLSALTAPPAQPPPRTTGAGNPHDGGPQLVRPYTRAHEQRTTETPTEELGPDEPPPVWGVPGARGPVFEDRGIEAPPGSVLPNAHRAANTSRSFLPLRSFPNPPDSEPVALTTAPVRVPRPRVVGRAAVSAEVRMPAPRAVPTGTAVWGTVSAPAFLLPAPAEAVPARVDEADADEQEARRRARAAATRLVAGLCQSWVDEWADLPIERLPPETRGFAQLPVLVVAFALAALITTVPTLLG